MPAFARGLKQAGLDYVQVTLESQSEEIHNRMVGSDSFHQTVQGIRNAVEQGIYVLTNSTITRDNHEQIAGDRPLPEGPGSRIAGRELHHQGRKIAPPGPRLERGGASAHPQATAASGRARGDEIHLVHADPVLPAEPGGTRPGRQAVHGRQIQPGHRARRYGHPLPEFLPPPGQHPAANPFEKIYQGDFLVSLRRRDWAMDKCRDCEWLATCGCGCPLQINEDSFCCPDCSSNP